MKWTEGRSNGATSVVKRSAIKSGAIAVGSKVSVVWGKSKKTYNAEVVGDGSVAQVQQANSHEDEPFAMELVDPAPADTQGPPREERQAALISRMEQLTDVVAGLEARILCRFDSIEYCLTKMQADLDCLKCAAAESGDCRPRIPVDVPPIPEQVPEDVSASVNPLSQEVETPVHPFLTRFESPALADMSNWSADGGSDYQSIAQEDVAHCLKACKSRRNLAGRLATRLFSAQERVGSNCRGACGKRKLNTLKVRSIYSCCIANFPLERLETSITAEKEMRNAIDEVCRKTKITQSENLLPA